MSETLKIFVGGVPVGGGAPVSVQTMTNTDTKDVEATVNQILLCEKYGLDIVRSAINDEADAKALKEIKKHIHVPVVADIQYDYSLAMWALENGADYIFQTDSDGQTDPEEFEKFWQIREGYDAIFGNRTSRGDGFSRAVVEKVLCAVLWTYFHVSVPDANAPFRLMKTDYVAEYLPLMPENYNLPNALLTAFGAYFHRKIRFIPISFKPRQGGTNSINIRKIVKIGRQALHDFCEIQKAVAKKRG